MSLADDLLNHAITGVLGAAGVAPAEVALRRGVSSAYYALFHRLTEDAARMIAPNVTSVVRFRVQRWFDHNQLKVICGRFTAPELSQPLLGLIGPAVSPQLQEVARSFVELQAARNRADYDFGYLLSGDEAIALVQTATEAVESWVSVRDTHEANIFMLSLLLWKNWDNERS